MITVTRPKQNSTIIDVINKNGFAIVRENMDKTSIVIIGRAGIPVKVFGFKLQGERSPIFYDYGTLESSESIERKFTLIDDIEIVINQ